MELPNSFKGYFTQDERHRYLDRTSSFGSNTDLSCESDQSLGLTYFIKEGDCKRKIQPGYVPCDICSEVQAVKFCQTCTISYCENHIRPHYRIPKLWKHTLVDVTGDLGQKLCQHDYSPLEVFCRTDQMLICSQCAETNHKGHDTVFYNREQAGRQLKLDQIRATSFTLHWSKAEGMEQTPQRFLIFLCCHGTEPTTDITEDCNKTLFDLEPNNQYTVSVSTVLTNGEQSKPVFSTICTRKKNK
ncbi:unnamed protein product, partial [Coregonus sp. 'balchen']